MNQPPQQPGWGQPQQPGPPQPGWVPPPPRKSSAGKIIGILASVAIGFFVVLGGCVALVASVDTSDSSTSDSAADSKDKPAAKDKPKERPEDAAKDADTRGPGWNDVKITSCGVDDVTGWPKAKVEITNHSSDPSDYGVEIAFNAGGKRIDEGYASSSHLANGETTTKEAMGVEDVEGKLTCKITSVTRYAS